MNNKVDIIARRILGWKLNNWEKWYDREERLFIHDSEFQPEHNIDHAMRIVKKLEAIGFTYSTREDNTVCFNNVCAVGDTLAQAITNAAFELADNTPIDDAWL
ncbi:BC1872 family protein [Schinkia sp. CFF1]